MLNNIKSYISNELPCISFEEYYIKYISQIQDMELSCEMSYLTKHNRVTLEMFDHLIDTAYRGIVQ